MVQVIRDPLLDVLRSKEQLAYKVNCKLMNTSGILGLVFNLFSVESKHSSEFIRARIENFFVQGFKKIIDEMTDEQFNIIKNAQIKMKHVADEDLNQKAIG